MREAIEHAGHTIELLDEASEPTFLTDGEPVRHEAVLPPSLRLRPRGVGGEGRPPRRPGGCVT